MPRHNASRSRSRSELRNTCLAGSQIHAVSVRPPTSSAVPLVSERQGLSSMQVFLQTAIQESRTRFPSSYGTHTGRARVVRHSGDPENAWLHTTCWDQSSTMTRAEQVSEVAQWTPPHINPFFIEQAYLSCIAEMVCSPSIAMIWSRRLEAWTFISVASRETNNVYMLEYRFERKQWIPNFVHA